MMFFVAAVFHNRLTDDTKGCTCSRLRCLLIILVLGTVSFFYSANKMEISLDWNPKWWKHDNSTKWWIFKKQGQIVVSPSMTESNTSMVKASSSKVADTMPHQPRNESAATQQKPMPLSTNKSTEAPHQTSEVTQQKPVPAAPVPYRSPGPYLVEYPYEYHFVINEPNKCEQQKPYLVLMVPVAPHNTADRNIVRQTWGGESLVLDKVVTLFFLLGFEAGEGAEQLQEQLLQESKEHRDLIQSDFLDSYKNLTIKTMVMLEWLDSHCSSASYAMKIDSDMFLNLPNLINMLLNAPKTDYMSGLVARGASVLRNPNSKWYVPVEIYPQPQYPRYALGLGYVLTLDLPKKLMEASRHIKALYIEDVYLGLCMEHLGIPPTDPTNWGYFNVFPVPYSRCAYSKLVATTTYEHTDRVGNWKDFKKPGPYC